MTTKKHSVKIDEKNAFNAENSLASMDEVQENRNGSTTESVEKNSENVIGCFDSCDADGIRGWVIDKNDISCHLEIDVFIDGELIIRTVANDFRQDLLDAGISNGYCSFNIPIPDKFFDSIEHSIDIKEVLTGISLSNSPKEFVLFSDGNYNVNYTIFLRKKLTANFSENDFDNLTILCKEIIVKQCYPLIDKAFIYKNEGLVSDDKNDILTNIFNGSINSHPLFDNDFYQKQADFNNIKITTFPLLHYLTIGWKLGFDPHPLFDSSYYRVDLNAAQNIVGEIDPLTAFLLSNDESRNSPSPFIDLLHLRHIMKVTIGYDFVTDGQLVIDALAMDWISIHPHIDRAMVSFLTKEDFVFEKPNATLQDVSKLVGCIRLGLPLCEINNTYSNTNVSQEQNYKKIALKTLSSIILNFNKPIYTILSAFSVFNATHHFDNTECLVVDNGSEPFFVELLHRYLKNIPTVKILSLKENRFFGEGNNIGIDFAKGDLIFLLNNDAIVHPKTIEQLSNALSNDLTLGAIAPVMILPNGQIQEVGGMISGCGQVIQKSKFIPFSTFATSYRVSDVRY